MIGLAKTVADRLRLWRWRKDQFENPALRRWFRDHHRIDVGLYSYGCFDQWRMPGPLIIGRYCSIASSVRSAPINHPFDAITTHPALYERKFGVVTADLHYDDPQVIEDDVWIGHNAMIAGAIVTRDVPRYTIVAGNPARPLRQRFPQELQDALEASQWWTLDLAQLRTLVLADPDLVFHPTAAAIAARAWPGRSAA
jgi:virginiamycin A acetyltransferase